MKMHFAVRDTLLARCGGPRDQRWLTPYADRVTCQQCREGLERDLPILQARIRLFSQQLAAKRRMRGA